MQLLAPFKRRRWLVRDRVVSEAAKGLFKVALRPGSDLRCCSLFVYGGLQHQDHLHVDLGQAGCDVKVESPVLLTPPSLKS